MGGLLGCTRPHVEGEAIGAGRVVFRHATSIGRQSGREQPIRPCVQRSPGRYAPRGFRLCLSGRRRALAVVEHKLPGVRYSHSHNLDGTAPDLERLNVHSASPESARLATISAVKPRASMKASVAPPRSPSWASISSALRHLGLSEIFSGAIGPVSVGDRECGKGAMVRGISPCMCVTASRFASLPAVTDATQLAPESPQRSSPRIRNLHSHNVHRLTAALVPRDDEPIDHKTGQHPHREVVRYELCFGGAVRIIG